MLATVQNIQHGNGHHVCISPTEIAVEGQSRGFRSRFCVRQAHPQYGICAQAGLVLGAVQLQQRIVERLLIERVHSNDCRLDRRVDVLDGAANALSAIARLLSIAQFERLMNTGRGPRWDDRAPHGRVGEQNLNLHRRIPA